MTTESSMPDRGAARHRRRSRHLSALVCASVMSLASIPPAMADCPQENAFYADRDRLGAIAFDAGHAAAPGVSNSFTMLIGDAALDGIVMWSAGVERPQVILMHGCPEGDVTGQELDACTLWQGIVYAVDEDGEIGLLPGSGEPAADRLLFPGLSWQMSFSPAFEAGELAELPWEVFERTGCAE